jgi:hypothetical protein
MALRDELKPNINKFVLFEDWVSRQPNSQEWFEVIDDLLYSSSSICGLLCKYGFDCDANFVARLRTKRGRTQG